MEVGVPQINDRSNINMTAKTKMHVKTAAGARRSIHHLACGRRHLQERRLVATQGEVLGADLLEDPGRANHHDIEPEVYEKYEILLIGISSLFLVFG